MGAYCVNQITALMHCFLYGRHCWIKYFNMKWKFQEKQKIQYQSFFIIRFYLTCIVYLPFRTQMGGILRLIYNPLAGKAKSLLFTNFFSSQALIVLNHD